VANRFDGFRTALSRTSLVDGPVALAIVRVQIDIEDELAPMTLPKSAKGQVTLFIVATILVVFLSMVLHLL
jgi:hypothetical protein